MAIATSIRRSSNRILGGPAGWTLLAYLLGLSAYLFLGPGTPGNHNRILAAGELAALLIAAFYCGLTSRSVGRGSSRWSWFLLSLAYVAGLLGRLLWPGDELLVRTEPTSLVLTSLASGTFYLLVALAMVLRLRDRLARKESATAVLNALMLTVSAFGISWTYVCGPLLDRAQDPILAVIGVSWPIGDLLIFLTLATQILTWPLELVPVSSLYLLVAFVIQLGADTAFTLLAGGSRNEPGGVIDLLWILSCSVTALAAIEARRASTTRDVPRGWHEAVNLKRLGAVRESLPYLSLPVAVWLLYKAFENQDQMGGDSEGVTHVVVAIIVVIGFLTLVSNHRLSRSLARLSSELEDRVVARTSELNALNRIATELSLCRTSEQVLRTGLALACEAIEVGSGAVWLLRLDRRIELVAHRGTDQSMEGALAGLTKVVPSLMEGIEGRKAVVLSMSDVLECAVPPLEPAFGLSFHLLVAPLVSRGTVLGLLGQIGEIDQERIPSCRDLLESIGAEMGIALESAQRFEHAVYLADGDPVTDLYNHRALHRLLEEELKRQQRVGRPFSLLMMDIDGFKLFNDTYGHPRGDQVLRDIAGVLTHASRESDVVARYGGDEFAAILPDTSAEGAVTYSQRVRAALAEHPFMRSDGDRVLLRLSFGVAAYPEDGHTAHELVGCADANLYDSKDRGGDTVTVAKDLATREVAKVGAYGILDGLVTAVDHKDKYTRKHSEHVTRLALMIGQAMGLSEETQRTLRIAGLLHDVGKIGVPDRVLRKPGRLDDDEFAAVKQHAILGEMIVKDLPNIADVMAAIGAHHERCDGHGYPRGLRSEDIPLLGRILAVADSYSAMTTDRPYRKAMPPEDAKAELLKVAGTQLDPKVVATFVSLSLEDDDEQVLVAG